MNWAMFTKRTEEPKLLWLERQLTGRGIPHRRNGDSFHAPILEVPRERLEAAWRVLEPVDDVPDEDPRWQNELDEMCQCAEAYPLQLDSHPPRCGRCGEKLFTLVQGR